MCEILLNFMENFNKASKNLNYYRGLRNNFEQNTTARKHSPGDSYERNSEELNRNVISEMLTKGKISLVEEDQGKGYLSNLLDPRPTEGPI